MAKDFSGQNLRGRSFKGENLKGANFRDADIRGTNFVEADLAGADFRSTRAGLQRRWWLFLLGVCLSTTILSGLLISFYNYLVFLIFNSNASEILAGAVGLTFVVIFCILIFRKGILSGIGFAIPTWAAGIVTSVVIAAATDLDSTGSGVVTAGLALAFALIGAIAAILSGAGAAAVAGAEVLILVGAILVSVSLLTTLVIGVDIYEARMITVAGTVVGNIAFCLFQLFIALRTLGSSRKERLINGFLVNFSASGGTNFQNSNLSKANFDNAILKGSDFRNATLVMTSFDNSEKFNLARWGNTILDNEAVRYLVCIGTSKEKSFPNCDFRGARLDGMNLNGFNFRGANLTNASLINAQLQGANLSHSQAIKADLSKAHLTGACIEGWNIDSTTKLEEVDCDYIFLLEHPNPKTGSRERRPHNPDKIFQPGDFQKLYTQIMHTVQFLLRNGDDPQAFATAFRELVQQYPDIQFKGIERVDEDLLVTAAVSASTNKEEVAQRFDHNYEQIRLENIKLRSSLESAEQHSQDFRQLAMLLASNSPNTNFNVNIPAPGGTAIVNDNRNQGITANEGSFVNTGSVQGSSINLGEISGDVSNAIGQLPTEKSELKPLLTDLRKAIEVLDITNEDKADALEELKKLSQLASGPSTPETSRKARKILTFMRGLPTAASVATIVSSIAQFFM